MKKQALSIVDLDFDAAVRDLKANPEVAEVLFQFESTQGTITKILFDEIVSTDESIFLDCDYLKPEGITKTVADEFIRIWFMVPNARVFPVQNGGLSLRLVFFDENGEPTEEVPFEEVLPEKMSEYYAFHIFQIIDVINQNGREKFIEVIKERIRDFNRQELILCVRTQILLMKGYSKGQILSLLEINENEFQNFFLALKERANPMPFFEAFRKETKCMDFLKKEFENMNLKSLSQTLEIFEKVKNRDLEADLAVQSLVKIWGDTQIEFGLN